MENILVHPSGHIKITDFGLALDNAIPGVMYTHNQIHGTRGKMILYSLQTLGDCFNSHYMKHYFT